MAAMKYVQNSQGTTLVEAIISIMLISLFVLWTFYFFNLQNKNILFFLNDQYSEDILDETYVFLGNYSYENIPEGLYGLSFQKDTPDTGTLSLKLISESDDGGEGKYLNSAGESIEYTRTLEPVLFKRTISVEEVLSPAAVGRTKKVSVRVWYPGCDFALEACKKKDFLITEPTSYE